MAHTNPRSERPKGDFFKLVGTALFIGAAVILGAWWAAKNNVDVDHYHKYLAPVLFAVALLFLVYRIALILFHRGATATKDDEAKT